MKITKGTIARTIVGTIIISSILVIESAIWYCSWRTGIILHLIIGLILGFTWAIEHIADE